MGKYSDIQIAVISFSKDSDVGFLKRLFRNGYKHCAIHLLINGRWISIDPLLSGLKIIVHDARTSFDMASHLRREGHDVLTLETINNHNDRRLRLGVFTCVEVIKRILNISKFFIVTPDQLFRYLSQNHQEKGVS